MRTILAWVAFLFFFVNALTMRSGGDTSELIRVAFIGLAILSLAVADWKLVDDAIGRWFARH